MNLICKRFSFFIAFFLAFVVEISAQQVYFTTGFKVSELGADHATVWTRLCANEKPNPVVHQRLNQVFRHPIDFDENMPISKMDGAVLGTAGWVRITLKSASSEISSGWLKADQKKDFTVFHLFKDLKPNTRYEVRLEGRPTDKGLIQRAAGNFTTAPRQYEKKELTLTTSTCQYFWSHDDSLKGFHTYQSMTLLKPDLFVQTGDYVYYDKPGPMATTLEKARHKWHAMDAWPSLKSFYQYTPVYMLKDDHDLLADDVHPRSTPFGKLSISAGLEIWYENVPLVDKPYRTLRWGKDVHLWFLEGREYRSNNDMPDGAEKTIWGIEQKNWLINTLQKSDATYKIIFSPTPIIGPDRGTKADNHSNFAFKTEGDWARKLLSEQQAIIVNGDRHWQYVSKDPFTGLMEFGSGPVSDFHAQGWPPNEKRPEHQFLRVAGGFLGIKMVYEKQIPILYLTHYDVKGKKLHEEKITK
jgi:alkaline phosphatase D